MNDTNPYLWLEDVSSEAALNWVRARNEKTFSALMNDERYLITEALVRKNAMAQDRIPYGSLRKGFVYNFWQDEKHVQGLWRRIPLENYGASPMTWETLLDVDELSHKQGKKWVFQGASKSPKSETRYLITLSNGGKDAAVVREFDTSVKDFVAHGFELPEAKSHVSWIDSDTLFLGTDFGEGSLTTSGYTNEVRIWKRGTDWKDAKIIFAGQKDDVSSSGFQLYNDEFSVNIVQRAPSFFESELFLYTDTGVLEKIPVPGDCDVQALFKDRLIFLLRSAWTTHSVTLPAGSVFALRLGRLAEKPELICAPTAKISIQDVSVTKNFLLISQLDNVASQILAYSVDEGVWKHGTVPLPGLGTATVISAEPSGETFLVDIQSFLIPATVSRVDPVKGKKFQFSVNSLIKQPSRFDESPFESAQFETQSTDGTVIPYFIVRSKNSATDGSSPTLLYGYGGFEIPLQPSYLSSLGDPWLARGGVYVIANIRGGGEFGPSWHQAALKENRHKAFEDFIAVAEDLIRRKITSAKHLGIKGGSNGGLLVGAVLVKRPDLFNAVVCQVPLLDMMRFHKLLAGASWRAEYGDPDIPAEAAYIRDYSPYQNLNSAVTYPKVFFITSTKDDRVHPGHARKMAARMEEFGKPFLYYENIDGGHGAAANLEEAVKRNSLEIVYLLQQLSGRSN